MKPGDLVSVPRFGLVKIDNVYANYHECYRRGYKELTYFDSEEWGIIGKVIATNTITFAAYRK